MFAPAAPPPTLVSYQGFVKVSGNAYGGTGYFKFAVVDVATGNGTTNTWANDGTANGEPSSSVALSVSSGLFTVMLGDTSLAGMTQAITQNVFNQTATYLRVWFSQTAGGPFQALDPNQRIGSAAYALRAERAEIAVDAEQLGGQSAATYQSRLTALENGTPWTNLTGVPAGFADNVDNDTTYAAGANLTLTGNTFALANDVSVNSLTSASSVKIGNAGLTCTIDMAGTVRWTGNALEVCDGSSWSAIQIGATKPIVLYQANNSVGVFGYQLGGRSGADSRCSSASSRPISGYTHYRAFLSVNTTDEIRDMPSNYGVPTTVPVISNSSALLAHSWYDLLDGTIINTLQAAGVYLSGPLDWWSGSTSAGALSSSCAGWTNGLLPATYGRVDQTGTTWINLATAVCSAQSNLLCIAY